MIQLSPMIISPKWTFLSVAPAIPVLIISLGLNSFSAIVSDEDSCINPTFDKDIIIG